MIRRGLRSINFILIGIFVFSFVGFVSSLSVDVHVPEKYTEVPAGERFYFEMSLKYPENPVRKDLRLEYNIIHDGEVVLQSKDLKAVETQASFLDFLVIPEGFEPGLYLLRVSVLDYEDLNEEIEASFYVVSGDSLQLRTYFYVLLGAIIFLGFIFVFRVSIKRRRDRSLELELFQ